MLNENLRLNLQFFAEADTGGNDNSSEGNDDSQGQSSDGKENTDKETEENQEHMIPKSRFDEINDNYKSVKQELDNIKKEQSDAEKAQKKKEEQEAEKRGEYENLYNNTKEELESVEEQYESAKKRIESLEGVITGLLDSKMENIDEEYHDLIPDEMTPEQKLNWVDNAEKKGLFNKDNSNVPVGEQTNPSDKETEVDQKSMNPMQKLMSGYGKK